MSDLKYLMKDAQKALKILSFYDICVDKDIYWYIKISFAIFFVFDYEEK